MWVITDNLDFAVRIVGRHLKWRRSSASEAGKATQRLLSHLVSKRALYVCWQDSVLQWKYLILVGHAPRSQYDVLIRLAREGVKLPDRVILLAGVGSGFHGFKDRPWTSLAGNIHLSAFLSPGRRVEHLGAALMVLPAVSVIEALDSIEGLQEKASVKWVNDIVIDNVKVCGVLAHGQSMGEKLTHIMLGIGVNVRTTPDIERSPFVPKAGALVDFVEDSGKCDEAMVFNKLIESLERNYHALLRSGYGDMLDTYRKRSGVIGRRVTVCLDDPCMERVKGTVSMIGDHLELIIEGVEKPITRGRLILEE
jgi:biotin-[acetyl-CoA-carboxylase] ligase BirA-like protein